MNGSTAGELVASWDAQQAAYINQREERFTVILDVLAAQLRDAPGHSPDGDGFVVLDVGCGPGSLSSRILDRFPRAHVIGLDHDPVLLTLATAVLDSVGERFVAVDADLVRDDWPASLPADRVDAAVSSTALHWLTPGQLVTAYERLGDVIRPDGVFLDADHLRYDPERQPMLARLAAADDEATQAAAHRSAVPTWDEWWKDALAVPELARHADERDRRFADRPPPPVAPLALHLSALEAAGFRETGTVWQRHDDFVVFARR